MIDDNVLFEDSVRLYQKLIELHKDDFELSGYPLDRHGFTHGVPRRRGRWSRTAGSRHPRMAPAPIRRPRN